MAHLLLPGKLLITFREFPPQTNSEHTQNRWENVRPTAKWVFQTIYFFMLFIGFYLFPIFMKIKLDIHTIDVVFISYNAETHTYMYPRKCTDGEK